jgi:hypothetical protein
MSNLALLAHEAKAAAPAFNGLFYATAATVIPVLFLAIAVQGTAFASLLKFADKADERTSKAVQAGNGIQILTASLTNSTAGGIAAVILFLGALGEINAITSLYLDHSWSSPK